MQPTASPAKVLVVEDEPNAARDLRAQVHAIGLEIVDLVQTAAEGLARALALRPELVLISLDLGAAPLHCVSSGTDGEEPAAMTGVQLAQAICTPGGPAVVFLTAGADELTLAQARGVEPVGFLRKPLAEHEVRTVLEMALFRQQADSRLRWMESALQAVSQGVIITDALGRIISVNSAFTAITGYAEAEVLGRERGFLLGPETDPATLQALGTTLNAGQDFSADIVHYRKDGKPFWDAVTVSALRAPSGEVAHFVTTLRDITAKRQAEAELRQLNDRFEQAVAGSADGLWDWNLTNDQVWFSPRYRELLGYAADDPAFGSTFSAFAAHVHADDLPTVQAVVARAVETGKSSSVDCRMRVVGDGWRWFSIRGAVTDHSAGRAQRMAGSITDITDRRRAEMALLARERELQTVTNSVPGPIARIDRDLRFVFANDRYPAVFSTTREALLGHTMFEVIAPELLEHAVPLARRALAGEELTFESEGIAPSGELQTWLVSFVPERDERGEVIGFVSSAADISARRDSERRLLLSEQRQELALFGADLGLWDTNLRTRSVTFDARCSAMLGLPAAEVVQHLEAWVRLMHPDDGPAVLELLRRHIEGLDAIYEAEFRMRHAAGHDVWILARGRVVERLPDGTPVRMAGTHVDVSTRKRDAEALLEAMNAAQAASRAKSEFLATMSHEVRTPMNGVIGMTSLLLDTPLSVEQREYTEIIRNSGENLLAIINDILDFSRIESGRFELEQAVFDVHECVDGVLELLRPSAHAKSLALRSVVAAGVPEYVRGDATRLRQILFNLVGNALKFTEQGGVTVNLSVDAHTSTQFDLHIAVSDTGIGIPLEAQATLFDAFMQVEASTTRKYGGTGLGLAITRRLTELMGGRVWLESEPGVGSTFHATLRVLAADADAALPDGGPFAVQARDALAAGAAPAPADESNVSRIVRSVGARVLLAEDNVVNQKVALGMLNKIGCRTDVVANGIEALAALRRQHYDVVLMDVQMPDMDGMEAARQIVRECADPASRPWIIALTANAMEGDREACLDAGMDDYLSKPMTRERVGEAIHRGLLARAARVAH